jgi:aminoglycoside 6'-N-acetyltransferase I
MEWNGTIRTGRPHDAEPLARMRAALWPESSVDEHLAEVVELLAGRSPGILPTAVFVAQEANTLAGFAEASIRSHADGCDPAIPAGYLEGWYVERAHRGKGIGAALLQAAEEWARSQGCVEMASDTWADNEASQQAHRALGFEEVDRCVHYRKKL